MLSWRLRENYTQQFISLIISEKYTYDGLRIYAAANMYHMLKLAICISFVYMSLSLDIRALLLIYNIAFSLNIYKHIYAACSHH